jgi:hypothetical protein
VWFERRDGHRMSAFTFDLDAVDGASVRSVLEAIVDELWRADGGRDGTPDQIRSPEQRRADALVELVRRATTTTGDGAGRDANGAVTGVPLRHQVVVVADLAAFSDDPTIAADARAVLVGATEPTPIPRRVLHRLLGHAEITGILFDGPGRPIWAGRSTRTPTTAQWLALLARDHGCVICGAPGSRCHAHHHDPWTPTGPTDIDNLVLLCTRHHHDLHTHHLQLTLDHHGWHLTQPQAAGRAPP